MEVITEGGAGSEKGKLCSEGNMLILQSRELESKLEAIIPRLEAIILPGPATAEHAARASTVGGSVEHLKGDEPQPRLEECEQRGRLQEANEATAISSTLQVPRCLAEFDD